MLRYIILITGLSAAGFFIWSVYAFAATPERFKTAAFGFLGSAIIFFILIIIRKIKDDRDYKKKISKYKDDPDTLRKLGEERRRRDFRR